MAWIDLRKRQKFALWICSIAMIAKPAVAQQSDHLRLEDCYVLAEKNYPLVKQRELLKKSEEYTLENVSKGYLPQLSINGQATYQSDVTRISVDIPGVDLSSLGSGIRKDQYKIYGEVSQSLTGWITTKQQKQLQAVNSDIRQENLEVDLYKLKDRINQLFFGVLLIDEQYRQNELLKQDIQNGIAKVNAAIANGIDFKSSVDKLKAELLKANQHSIELRSSRKSYTDMLGLFIDKNITDSTVFEKPLMPAVSQTIKRPELTVFDSQSKSDEIQRKLLNDRNIPGIELFFQGGLGDPSPVNMLEGGLSPYYIGGIRLNWSLSRLYTFNKDRQLLEIDKSMTDAQKETFLFNTNLTLKQQNDNIAKLKELIKSDYEIVALRTSVKETASVQLENGAISVNDFLKEVNSEDQAQQDRLLHEMQLLMVLYDHKDTAGN